MTVSSSLQNASKTKPCANRTAAVAEMSWITLTLLLFPLEKGKFGAVGMGPEASRPRLPLAATAAGVVVWPQGLKACPRGNPTFLEIVVFSKRFVSTERA